MFTITSFVKKKVDSNKELALFIGSIALTILLLFYLSVFGFGRKFFILPLLVPIILASVLNFNVSLILGVLLLFVPTGILYHYVVYAPILVTLSYLLILKPSSSKNDSKIKNPLLVPFFIYILSTFPSLLNNNAIVFSYVSSLQLLSMFLLIAIIGRGIINYSQLKFVSIAFVCMCLINGLDIVSQITGVMNERVFGFTGVVFVDFVCVGIIISVLALFFFKRKKIFPFVTIPIFLVISLLLTQTRNTLVSLSLTTVVSFLYLYLFPSRFNLSRKKIFKIGSTLLILGGVLGCFLFIIKPDIFGRLFELFTKKNISISGIEDFGQNSLITRVLIWITALNAFIHHPIVGIGFYSFTVTSNLYSIIPKDLYAMFVKSLSPHVTYLTVITETGLIGLFGFIIFLGSILHMNLKSLRNSFTEKQLFTSFCLFACQIYIFCSMLMSDAWFWGQCLMLWGFIAGCSLANFNIIQRSKINDQG